MSEETRCKLFLQVSACHSQPRNEPELGTMCLFEFGPFRLDPAERRLLRGDETVPLTPKAFDTLLLLVQNSGRLLQKEDLIRMLWSDAIVEEGGLSNNIFLVRKALGEDVAYIETVPRRGYRFVGSVRQFPRTVAAGLESPTAEGTPIVSVAGKPRRIWRGRAWLGIVVIALLAAAGWFLKWTGRDAETIDSVAVLPFVNASGDPNTEYLSDGITESLINSLSQLPHLKVMSRDTTFRFKGREADPKTVGRQLGVRTILKGILIQRGDSINISVELIDSRDGSHLWGQRYDRKLADMDTLREGIAQEMANALRLRLTPADRNLLVKGSTANPEAYQDYLKGRYWWNKSTLQGYEKGMDYFQQAIAKDPSYALAYSGLADCYSSLADSGLIPFREGYLKAKDAALKAVELDDTLAEAHGSLALVKSSYDWDWPGADKEIRRAIELNPGHADAHRLHAEVLWETGRLEEAIAESKLTLEFDPLSISANDSLGFVYFLARRYDLAIQQEAKTLELDPNFIGAYYVRGVAYLKKSRYEEGTAEFEKGVAISPQAPEALTGLGYGYAVAGKRAEARKVLDKLAELSKHEFISAVWRAKIYSGLEEKDLAFEWLEKAYEDRSIVSVGFIKSNPMFDPLRSDPRYTNLLLRTNLQP